MDRADRLVEYIRAHPEFKVVPSMDDHYHNMGVTLTDAVLQAV